jgi:formyl-CoA transferase
MTVSSPIQVHGVTKVAARRANEIGEHNEEVLTELGFGAKEIDGLRADGVIPGQIDEVAKRRRPA